MGYSVTRYHDFSMGHRVVGHEGKCRYLHGHNYRAHFTVAPMPVRYVASNELGLAVPAERERGLDDIGRVIDFSVLKELGEWIEQFWDHRMLLWDDDPHLGLFVDITHVVGEIGLVLVPFNPTAENLAHYLLTVVGPAVLPEEVVLVEVKLEETRKCSATVTLE